MTISPTQRYVTYDDVTSMVSTALDVPVVTAEPLSGGSFGAVWGVDLADGRAVVLKAGPATGARLLTYEADMLGCEATYLRIVAESGASTPAPRLLAQSDDFLIMSRLPGVPMSSLPSEVDTRQARYESGVAIANLHAITRTYFGYGGPRPRASTWPDACRGMFEALLADADDWDLTMPIPPARIRAALDAHHDALAAVTEPVLCHFDLWDGNVIVTAEPGRSPHLSGLVDGERFLFGDPMVDFASPALFREVLTADDPFLAGYRSVRPFQIDDGVRVRAWVCQLYLYLVMLVEFPSRGRTPSGEAWDYQVRLVDGLLKRLGV